MWLAGVDGCPAGWVAALAPAAGPSAPRLLVVPRFADLFALPEAPAVVAVDMPIGLPDRVGHGGRGPESLVRPLLGERQSSVFSVPSRAAVYAGDYSAACAAALATSDPPRRVSKQCFCLFPKIRELDALLRGRPDLAGRVFEAHPEVAFWRLNGERALDRPKKVKGRPWPEGPARREGLLRAAGFGDGAFRPPPPGAGPDDVLDALATLTVALRIARGEARSFPDPPGRDGENLPVAIWT
ncbi:DUF429 domain-containing protein [Chelatococcus composti]|uniref:Putative RNase H-like nuclease n=1 Tax=Chelatococcus composti TaxID=1743235 RepID=A0A841K9V7_9HYPH|nr:DUF429 domain-containing protein [Chelatococcus composti]MBB6169065.1 putative RNase H-like nuclease [Chelatococcus composti]MBS7736053.1 DUF429 domain-containing protein [Chelatococcus composti]PZN44717.1 MAG: DUF429 domain-containing protein [Pseudomonadota bacterium]GGG44940.1 hypothetical protein GCM10008026_27510 [Chelatococcus composti]